MIANFALAMRPLSPVPASTRATVLDALGVFDASGTSTVEGLVRLHFIMFDASLPRQSLQSCALQAHSQSQVVLVGGCTSLLCDEGEG